MENKFEYKVINSKYIVSNPKYQRPINQARINKMIAEFDKNLVNPPKLSSREGKYFVFDGQHTIALLKAMNDNQDLPILCKVYEGMTEQDEAVYFEKQFGIFRKPSSNDLFKSKFNRGEQDVADIVWLLESHGFHASYNYTVGDNRVVALQTVYNGYVNCGRHVFEDVLIVLRGAWDGQSSSLRQEIFGGLLLFCKNYRGKYDRQYLIKKLKKVDPEKLIREGKAGDKKGDLRFCHRILVEYNKSLHANRIESDL